MWAKPKQPSGFTIVELLIVIVVIGILAAITIVAYSGVQQKARDAARTSDIKQVQKAIDLYYVDSGNYPSLGVDGSGYDIGNLSAVLVPKYLVKLPTDPQTGAANYQYVRGTLAEDSYGIRISYEAKPACHTGVNNVGRGWWGLSAC